MHKKILIPTDGSEISKKAALEGIELATKYGSRVIGLYVVDINAINIMDCGSIEFKRARQKALINGEKALSYIEDLANRHGVRYEKLLKRGDPAEEIKEAAKEHNVDLIVLGTHKRTGLKKLLYKSVAEESIKNSPCPVMLATC